MIWKNLDFNAINCEHNREFDNEIISESLLDLRDNLQGKKAFLLQNFWKANLAEAAGVKTDRCPTAGVKQEANTLHVKY